MTVTSSIKSAQRNVMIVAGEASGDLHGSNLLKSAAEICPQVVFSGVGGAKMRAAGCRILFPSDELSVMGVQEVFAALPRILKRFRQLKQALINDKPELLVLIDFPDFNLRLAKVAKKHNIPVLYYISPKVWAWRSGRARTIAERVDRLALIFPFEPAIYEKLGVRADYVGNPLLDEYAVSRPQGGLRRQLGLTEAAQIVGIFPGSRNSELQYILPSLVETAAMVHRSKPDVQFIVPVAPSLSREAIEARFSGFDLPVHFVEENIYEVAAACDAVLSVSGTVTLQLALSKTPMAIVYKVAPLSYQIGKRLIKVEHVGLTNIVAERSVVREFIQDDAAPAVMRDEILKMLDDQAYRAKMIAALEDVCRRLGEPGCSQRVAHMVAEMTGPEEESK